jgi:hypothetical protein
MKKNHLLAAAISIAILFTLSCAGKKPAAYPQGAYVETGGGFLIVPPDSWEIVDDPEDRFKIFMAYEEGAFGATANFEISPRSNLNLDGFAAFLVEDAKTTHNANILGQQDFKTAKGLKGKKTVATMAAGEHQIRFAYYLFPSETGKYIFATGSVPSLDEKFNALFDEAMKTFEWIE